jgi:hypothetical protein
MTARAFSNPRLVAVRLALLLTTAVIAFVLRAGADEHGVGALDGSTDAVVAASGEALAEAKAALATNPQDRAAARGALERATSAGDEPLAVAEAYFRLGVLEEEDGAFVRALADQRACTTKGAGTSFARSARLRIGWISARSEGDFAPLARLQRVRRDPVLLYDPAAIESLATDAEAFPPGRVRAEARMFVAGAWLHRMNRKEDAIGEMRKVVDDASSDSTDASLAHRRLVETFLADRRLDDAEREVKDHPFDPKLGAEVGELIRHRTLRRAAFFVVPFALLALVAGVARARRRDAPSLPSP